MPSCLSLRLSLSTTASKSASDAVAGRRVSSANMPVSPADFSLLRTYTSDAGFSPTSTIPRPGGRPAFCVNAATAGATSDRICCPIATPSSNRAGMSPCFRFESFERIGPAEDHELVAAADDDVRVGIELHPEVGALNAHDDDPEALAE